MQISKKRILGASGLALVAGTTFVAHNIQTPSAYAIEAESEPVTINVVVQAEKGKIAIEIGGPIQNGGATSEPNVNFPIRINSAAVLRYSVSASQDGHANVPDFYNGEVEFDEEGHVIVHSQAEGDEEDLFSGTYNLNLPLEQLANQLASEHGYDLNRDIIFTLKASVTNDGGYAEDTISFSYGKISIDPNINIKPDAPENETNVPTTDNGNPVIEIGVSDEVETVHVIVRDPVTGAIIWEGDVSIDPNTGKAIIPFVENNIPAGNYIIEVQARDKNGNIIGTSKLEIRYVPIVPTDVPGLPNTGGISIAGLNIAQSDFLITSAIAFFVVSAGGIYLIHRKQTRR